jgi:hypothetical protein
MTAGHESGDDGTVDSSRHHPPRVVRMVASATTADSTRHHHRRVVRMVASASTGAEDCAALLAALGLDAADGVLTEGADPR